MADQKDSESYRKKKSSESVTVFYFGPLSLSLREMAIGRTQLFASKLLAAMEGVGEEMAETPDQLDLASLIMSQGDKIFEKLTGLFNFVFEYKNPDFESVDLEWIKEWLTIRAIKEIGETIIEQNRMEGLVPLLKRLFLEAFGKGQLAPPTGNKKA